MTSQQADTLAAIAAAHKAEGVNPAVFALAILGVAVIASVISYRAVVALSNYGKDDKGSLVAWALLKTFPTTPGRIVVELTLAVLFVVGCMIADMIGRPVSEGTQNTLGLFVAAMLGIGAGQFFGKRKTDADYVAAKNAGPGSTSITADTANVGVNNAVPTAPPADGSSTTAPTPPPQAGG